MDLAVTGGIGTGKSTVAAMLAEKGGVHLNADAVVHELQQPGSEVFQGMVELFGEGVVASDGTLDRQAVAEIVFANEAQLQALNDLVHPAVRAEMQARREAHKSRGEVVISEIPLLVEGRLKQAQEAEFKAESKTTSEVFAKRAARLAAEAEWAEQRVARLAAESELAAKRLAEAHKSAKGPAKREAKQAARQVAEAEREAQRATELAATAAADAEAASAADAGADAASSSSHPEFDAVIVVVADREVVLARLAARGLPREEALARMAQQATDEQRQAIADYIINNSGDLAQLQQDINECWEWLRARQSSGAA